MKNNDRVVDPSMDTEKHYMNMWAHYADATPTIVMISANDMMIEMPQIILRHEGFIASLENNPMTIMNRANIVW